MVQATLINGRKHYFNRVIALRRLAPGKYQIETKTNGTFTVEGGRQAGGKRTYWFLESPKWRKPIECKSIVDACQLIETM